ncbi:hypothetical protein L6270_02220 [Candidatus Parcubacteria bacterium]|nr:hypothetical protein [Patescibacteria group bacterium]MBU4309472.1 hypothetical protein [Patescibacteria group bacterium]MBU4577178.1 hypothetical protein [Patescibacteria group bacterium]MCG2696826.1 hypothetical protein [Candidatus Parcubacteria bacterium]
MNIKEEAYKKAVEVLTKSAKSTGFYASALKGGYEATWARDSMITTLGASLLGKDFKKPIVNSIDLLAKYQTENGQVPNCVGAYNLDRRSKQTYNSIDSSLWFIIGNYAYAKAYKDHKVLDKYKKNIARAYVWLKYQDPNEDGLLSQQPTMDWMDAFPHKYGNTINTQALYYATLRLLGGKKLNDKADHLKKVVNGDIEAYLKLYDDKLGYYLPWNWKNHDGDREQEEWFDSLGNVLAIVTGLANKNIAYNILDHIEKEKINEPYGLKALWPPIKPGDKEWHSYFSKCDAREPLHYLNGGIWPFIGGFYVAALVKMKEFDKAEKELNKLAYGNMQKMQIRDFKTRYEFNEWLHGESGEPMGEPFQAWTAATYIYGYECLKKKKVLFFE